jgi:RNA polymerase sigma-70 factor (ECF subfamily)
MLTEDAKYAMPPEEEWYEGLPAIREFLLKGPLTVRWRFVPAWVNGQVAFGTYMYQAERGGYVLHAMDVLTFRGRKVAAVTAFLDPDTFAQFGLPMELPA